MPEQLVLTPGGFRPKSLVNVVEPDHGLILDRGVFNKMELATNTLTAFAKPPAIELPFGAFGPRGAPTAPPTRGPAAGAVPSALPDGWQTYAWWDSGGTSITHFSTTWTVPSPPRTNSGQTVFIFNGIQNGGSNYGILQPVLQWGSSGAGGGDYWSVASWYVTSSGQAFHTTLVPVIVGQELVGVMTQTSTSGGLHSYESKFQGFANTTLPVQNIAPLTWANETLEAYGLNQCSDFPKSAVAAMRRIDIHVGATHPRTIWTPVDAVMGCGQHTTVVSNANPGGKVYIWYSRICHNLCAQLAEVGDELESLEEILNSQIDSGNLSGARETRRQISQLRTQHGSIKAQLASLDCPPVS